MSERKTTITLPNGTFSGDDVPVKETTERWTDIALEDGSTMRLKTNVLSVIRLDGQYDPEGNPLYVVKTNNVMVITNVPAHLRKGATSSKLHN